MSINSSKTKLLLKFSRRLKFFRLKQKLSQKEVALKCGMDFSSYTNIENGKRNVTLVTLQRILVALNINFKEFFNF